MSLFNGFGGCCGNRSLQEERFGFECCEPKYKKCRCECNGICQRNRRTGGCFCNLFNNGFRRNRCGCNRNRFD